ncbi:MAG TPA: ParA family protein [Phycisphaerales bacterium]|nr:ParA family protein [Phycisphaerales bacterium]
MATIITIASQKGGVGKTTTALNLGYSLSRKGKKILIVDGDPQGGFTAACNLKKKTAKGLLHILDGIVQGADAIQPLYHGQLAALGSGVINAEDIALYESAAAGEQLATVLRDLAAGYDYLLIDAPVGVGVIVKALLSASDLYLIVINCKAGTMKTLPRLMKTGEWVKKNVNSNLEFLGVLVNMYDAENPSEVKIYTYFKSSLSRKFFFDSVIPLDNQLETASFRSVPVAMVAEGAEVAAAFDRFADELLSRVNDTAETSEAVDTTGSDGEKFEDDFYTNLLKELCEKSDYYGAVLADEMGFPLADYNCPINTDALAAFTSVLGDSLEKAESILEQEDANNITLEINESDKVALRRLNALNSTYFLLVICPQAAVFPGLVELTISEIIAKLTE